MNNLSEFLKRNFHIFLFVILQIVCIIMISKSMKYTSFALDRFCQTIVSPINEAWYNVIRHFSLEAENEQLVQQNIALLDERDNAFTFKDDSVYTAAVCDSNQRVKMRLYDYSYANIVYKTTDKTHNYIIIDKGRADGVTIDMAVLSAGGVCGVVSDVTEHFSSIISLLHPDARISARLLPSNQIGTVLWDGISAKYAQLYDIPQHVPVTVGDSIVTSGYSNIFPKDILVGIVEDVHETGHSSFLTIKVRLATNFNNVNTVYLIRNIYTSEMDELKSNFKDE
ncbi:MAG: rod shape-determining protein MreC [Bacteroidales bacterium]|nr:rod shape-determining protein MreC [Bacteroidales bacterium]